MRLVVLALALFTSLGAQGPYSLAELDQKGIPPVLANVHTQADWEKKRAAILKAWLDTMGGLPPRPAVHYQVKEIVQMPGYKRERLVFNSVDNDPIPAFLLVPDGMKPTERRAAILALHSTLPNGKASVATPEGMVNRTYALELAQRGYVVLAPDALTAGERTYPNHPAFDSKPFYEKYPHWSTVGKNLTDHLQAMDLLCSLPMVDPNRIGVIGHSFGAYNAYFLGGMDPRIKAVVSSCGLDPFSGNATPGEWGYRPYPYTHLPQITADLAHGQVPFEFNEIMALTAPTPLFVYAAQSDHLFPHWQSVGSCLMDVRSLYVFLGREDAFVSFMGSGDHDFPPAVRTMAYAFLDRWVRGTAP